MTTALRMRQNPHNSGDFVISQYSSVTDDVTNARRSERSFVTMTVSCEFLVFRVFSYPQNFDGSVCYALSKLGLSGLTLKNEQKQAIYAVYGRKDVFVYLLTGFSESISFQILPFLFDHKRALVDGKKRSCVTVSPRIALMVDQVGNLMKSGVQAVISCYSRESSVGGEKSLATESNFISASHISRNSGPYRK